VPVLLPLPPGVGWGEGPTGPGVETMTSSRPKLDDHLNAFCHDTEAHLAGAPVGPLAGLTLCRQGHLR
jgi:hypothetical protein